MALSLCMGSWRRLRPEAKYVLWLRVDQKSCFKSIFHAGFEPLIVEPVRDGDALVSDIETVNRILGQRAEEVILITVMLYQVPHLVNNAYGLQSEECIRRLNAVIISAVFIQPSFALR
ncbi:putative O-phosphoseryl-tRNA(Sec) selenium transferase [Cooperia oncophora]